MDAKLLLFRSRSVSLSPLYVCVCVHGGVGITRALKVLMCTHIVLMYEHKQISDHVNIKRCIFPHFWLESKVLIWCNGHGESSVSLYLH